MPKIEYSVETTVAPDRVIAAATDFSPHRLELWPGIDPKAFEVREVGERTAIVREGSNVMGGIWAVERYDWSVPNEVSAVVQESNFFHPGGRWQMRVKPLPDGGSRIEILNHRTPKGLKGALFTPMFKLMGASMLKKSLLRTLAVIAADERGPLPSSK